MKAQPNFLHVILPVAIASFLMARGLLDLGAGRDALVSLLLIAAGVGIIGLCKLYLDTNMLECNNGILTWTDGLFKKTSMPLSQIQYVECSGLRYLNTIRFTVTTKKFEFHNLTNCHEFADFLNSQIGRHW